MTFDAVSIATGLSPVAGGMSKVRRLTGEIMVAHYDTTTTPRRVATWTSTGDGRAGTWAQETFSQNLGGPAVSFGGYSTSGDGGRDPRLLVDPLNRVYIACASYGGIDSPHIFMRNELGEYWTERTSYGEEFLRLSQRTAVTKFDAGMDDANSSSNYRYNIACVYLSGGNAHYTDLGNFTGANGSSAANRDQLISAATDVRIACQQGGTKSVFYVRAGTLFMRQKTGVGDTAFGIEIQVSLATDVTSIEDAGIRADSQPAVLYLEGADLWFAEWDFVNQVIVRTKLPGTGYSAGATLCIDVNNSVFVGAYQSGEITTSVIRRDKNPSNTTFAQTTNTNGSQSTMPLIVAIDSDTPTFNRFQAQKLQQGYAFAAYLHPAAGTPSLYFFNLDTLESPNTDYPTIFPMLSGFPMYRPGDLSSRSDALLPTVIVQEDGKFPDVKADVDMSVQDTFVVDEKRYDLPYTVHILKFTANTEVFVVSMSFLDRGAYQTIRDFVLTRLKQIPPKAFRYQRQDRLGETIDEKVVVHSVEADTQVEATVDSPAQYVMQFTLMRVP